MELPVLNPQCIRGLSGASTRNVVRHGSIISGVNDFTFNRLLNNGNEKLVSKDTIFLVPLVFRNLTFSLNVALKLS